MEKAVEIGCKIIGAIFASTGLPTALMNLSALGADSKYAPTTLADVGSLSLELKYLSYLTGDNKYEDVANTINEYLINKTPAGEMLRKAAK